MAHAERFDLDFDRPLSVVEMCDLLRGAGQSPYCFLRLAVVELTVKDNRQAALCYVAYAEQFIGKFFDNASEDQAFQVMVDTVHSFIPLWEMGTRARVAKKREG